jgi:hypothetical protein
MLKHPFCPLFEFAVNPRRVDAAGIQPFNVKRDTVKRLAEFIQIRVDDLRRNRDNFIAVRDDVSLDDSGAKIITYKHHHGKSRENQQKL